MTPTAPGSTEPTWQRALRLSDGRIFVTDGGLAIDASLARPATIPPEVAAQAGAAFIERQLSAVFPDEFRLAQLSRPDTRVYSTPSGVHLNSAYIDFLRRTVPNARLRTSGTRDPVVIVVEEKAAGVFMPVAR